MAVDATLDDVWNEAQQQKPGDDQLSSIARMVDEVRDLDNQIAMAETVLADLKAQRYALVTDKLPDAMAAAGTASFTTKDGLKVTVEDHISGSIGDQRTDPQVRQARINYIVECGGGGIVTADTILKFGRANRDAAFEAAKMFEGRDDCVVDIREDIHHSTLKAWARDRLKSGLPFEPERAGLWVGRIAKIEHPKKK